MDDRLLVALSGAAEALVDEGERDAAAAVFQAISCIKELEGQNDQLALLCRAFAAGVKGWGSGMKRYRWTAELFVDVTAEEQEAFFQGLEERIGAYMAEWTAHRRWRVGDLATRVHEVVLPGWIDDLNESAERKEGG